MYCPKCGRENGNADLFCASCGAPLAAHPSPVGQRVLFAVNDPLFLMLCILYSVFTVLALFSGGIPVIPTLLTVFLWMTYAQGKAGKVPGKALRCVSGTVYAQYVLQWILFGFIALLGILMMTLASAIDIGAIVERILLEVESRITQSLFEENGLTSSLFAFGFTFVGILLMLIAACGIIWKVIGLRSVHRFLQSSYQATGGYGTVCKIGAAKNWLIVFAVTAGLGAMFGIFSPFVLLMGISKCAAFVLASVLISRYFGK